jgi:hypothetical protein
MGDVDLCEAKVFCDELAEHVSTAMARFAEKGCVHRDTSSAIALILALNLGLMWTHRWPTQHAALGQRGKRMTLPTPRLLWSDASKASNRFCERRANSKLPSQALDYTPLDKRGIRFRE